MKKQVKIWIAAIVAVVLLVGCGLWVYYGRRVSLAKYLPEDRGRISPISFSSLPKGDRIGSGHSYVADEQATEIIYSLLSETKLRRIPFKEELLDCEIVCQFSIGRDATVGVTNDGIVALRIYEDGLNSESKLYWFSGGEELYQELHELSKTLRLFETS